MKPLTIILLLSICACGVGPTPVKQSEAPTTSPAQEAINKYYSLYNQRDTAGAWGVFNSDAIQGATDADAVLQREQGRQQITDAWALFQENKEKRIARAKKHLSELVKSSDSFSGTNWYKPRTAKRDVIKSHCYAYLAQGSSGNVTPRLRLQTTGDSWLFAERADINIEGQTYNIIGVQDEWKRDNSGYSTWEWVDRPIEDRDKDWINALGEGTYVIRFTGRQYRRDFTFSKQAVNDFKAVLMAKEAL